MKARALLELAMLGAIIVLAVAHFRGRGGDALGTVIAPADRVQAGEPDPEAGLLERAVRPERKPEQVAIAPGAAAADVRAFCAAAGRSPPRTPAAAPTSSEPSMAELPPPVVALERPEARAAAAAVLLSAARGPVLVRSARGNPWSGRFELWALTPAGDVLHEERGGVRGPWTLTVQGGQAFVQSSRGWWIRPLIAGGLGAGAAVLLNELGAGPGLALPIGAVVTAGALSF